MSGVLYVDILHKSAMDLAMQVDTICLKRPGLGTKQVPSFWPSKSAGSSGLDSIGP